MRTGLSAARHGKPCWAPDAGLRRRRFRLVRWRCPPEPPSLPRLLRIPPGCRTGSTCPHDRSSSSRFRVRRWPSAAFWPIAIRRPMVARLSTGTTSQRCKYRRDSCISFFIPRSADRPCWCARSTRRASRRGQRAGDHRQPRQCRGCRHTTAQPAAGAAGTAACVGRSRGGQADQSRQPADARFAACPAGGAGDTDEQRLAGVPALGCAQGADGA